ncbi:MAG TPA: 30S ribosomal protein S2 [Verrucomicrobiae bacterium]|nr:30S ribosomal protein S2 [Verrucomicrobiae bacterium]
MADITIKQLLEAGVHFGHQTQRWNPKMKKYIFGERNGIYIINLEITVQYLKKGLEYVKGIAGEGKEILFVGTKKQAQDPISDAAQKCDMPYVNQRWLGGMLTNFDTIRKSLGRLDMIDQMEKDGSFQFVTKKEAGSLKKEREKLQKNLMGIRALKRLPGAIFVIDAKKEEIAIKEARKLGIPVIAVLDTNCDPDVVDWPFPGNDDAIRAIKLFCESVAEAAKEGRDGFKKIVAEQEAQRAKEAEEKAEAAAADKAGSPLSEEQPELAAVVEKAEKVAQVEKDKKQKTEKAPKPLRK